MAKKGLKNIGRVFLIVIFGSLVLGGSILGLAYVAGFALLIYEKIEDILNIVVLIGSIAVLFRAITVVSAIIPRKSDTHDKKQERLLPLKSTTWIAICVLFLVLYPIQSWLSIIHAPVPEGDYVVDLEYHLYGEDEYGYDVIDKCGIAPFVINIDRDVYYEDHTYYSGAVEQTGTRVSQETSLYVESVDLPYYGEYELYDDVYGAEGEAEVEIDGIVCTLYYTIGDLTEERLGYTLEDKISNIAFQRKVEFVAFPLMAVISIAGALYAIRKPSETYSKLQDKKYAVKSGTVTVFHVARNPDGSIQPVVEAPICPTDTTLIKSLLCAENLGLDEVVHQDKDFYYFVFDKNASKPLPSVMIIKFIPSTEGKTFVNVEKEDMKAVTYAIENYLR